MDSRKSHWENVYKTKTPQEVSWTQLRPDHSLRLIAEAQLPLDAAIINVGGGDSDLVDHLLDQGYSDITVLDISEAALERAKRRLGDRADQVIWIVEDINHFVPDRHYTLWHDRATFHFLIDDDQIDRYIDLTARYVDEYLVLATFSTTGPQRCSGLDISQYSSQRIKHLFDKHWEIQESFLADHVTPFETRQNFLYCHMKKRQ